MYLFKFTEESLIFELYAKLKNKNVAQVLTVQKDHREQQAEENHIKSDSKNIKRLTELNSSKTPNNTNLESSTDVNDLAFLVKTIEKKLTYILRYPPRL